MRNTTVLVLAGLLLGGCGTSGQVTGVGEGESKVAIQLSLQGQMTSDTSSSSSAADPLMCMNWTTHERAQGASGPYYQSATGTSCIPFPSNPSSGSEIDGYASCLVNDSVMVTFDVYPCVCNSFPCTQSSCTPGTHFTPAAATGLVCTSGSPITASTEFQLDPTTVNTGGSAPAIEVDYVCAYGDVDTLPVGASGFGITEVGTTFTSESMGCNALLPPESFCVMGCAAPSMSGTVPASCPLDGDFNLNNLASLPVPVTAPNVSVSKVNNTLTYSMASSPLLSFSLWSSTFDGDDFTFAGPQEGTAGGLVLFNNPWVFNQTYSPMAGANHGQLLPYVSATQPNSHLIGSYFHKTGVSTREMGLVSWFESCPAASTTGPCFEVLSGPASCSSVLGGSTPASLELAPGFVTLKALSLATSWCPTSAVPSPQGIVFGESGNGFSLLFTCPGGGPSSNLYFYQWGCKWTSGGLSCDPQPTQL